PILPQLIVLPSQNGVFFDLFLLSKNMKVAIYKAFRISGKSKKAKKYVVIARFFEN
ncbi:unnamed protein product, partial [marine sediment metagenome]